MEVSNQTSETQLEADNANLDGQETINSKLEKSVKQEKNLRERLKAQESELNTLKEQMRLESEKKMKEQNQYKELYEQERKTLEQLKKEKDDLIQAQLMAKRLNAFDNHIGKLKHQDFYKLLPIDEILIDDNGEIMKESVELVAKKVSERYGSDIFEKKQVGKLPAGTPAGVNLDKDYNKMSRNELKNEMNSALLSLHKRR